MRYASKAGNAASTATDCLVVPRRAARALAESLGVAEHVDLVLDGTSGKTGSVAKVFLKDRPSRLLIVGAASSEKQADPETKQANFRRDARAAAAAIAALDVAEATVCIDDFDAGSADAYWKTRTVLAAVSHAAYRFTPYKSNKPAAAKLRRVGVLSRQRAKARRAVGHAQALDEGLALAKDLGNQPPNICNPTYLAREARKVARGAANVTTTVLDENKMTELGMGAFMSVTRGTNTPAKLIIVNYKGGTKGDAPVVLLGKGITFDTGGINIKSSAGMEEMKWDMCGAASVLGAAKAAIAAELPVNLIAMAAAAENMPSGAASRPSDIVTTMSGQTVEILNTDAEGRLVLCDALTYADRFKPAAVVDVATLTGAQVVALGSHASALYANDDLLAETLASAGEASGDRMWRMPLWDEYQSALDGAFADIKNVGGGRAAGSIVAACFLSRFTKAYPWAHLDIAGSAYVAGKGSTGRPVPALFEYLVKAGTQRGAP